jgi:hypothetical protein
MRERQHTAHSPRHIRVEHGIAHPDNRCAPARRPGRREHISDTARAVRARARYADDGLSRRRHARGARQGDNAAPGTGGGRGTGRAGSTGAGAQRLRLPPGGGTAGDRRHGLLRRGGRAGTRCPGGLTALLPGRSGHHRRRGAGRGRARSGAKEAGRIRVIAPRFSGSFEPRVWTCSCKSLCRDKVFLDQPLTNVWFG